MVRTFKPVFYRILTADEGGVDNGVGVHPGDVPLDKFELFLIDCGFHLCGLRLTLKTGSLYILCGKSGINFSID